MSEIKRFGVSARSAQAVVYNGLVFLSGVVPGDNPPAVDIRVQAQMTLDKIDKQLVEAGSARDKLLQATVYLRDINDFEGFNEVWNAWVVPGCPPARTAVMAAQSRQNNLCEVTLIAATSEAK